MAAGVSRRNRETKPQGPRFLRPPARRTARRRHRTLRDAVSLGLAASAAGSCRRMAIQRHLESVCGLCGLCRGTLDRSRQEHLHAQRARPVPELRLRMGHRRPRSQTASGRIEPGPPPRGLGPWSCRAGDPRERPRRDQSRHGREHRSLRAGDRYTRKHSRRRDGDARIECGLPGRDPGGTDTPTDSSNMPARTPPNSPPTN